MGLKRRYGKRGTKKEKRMMTKKSTCDEYEMEYLNVNANEFGRTSNSMVLGFLKMEPTWN